MKLDIIAVIIDVIDMLSAAVMPTSSDASQLLAEVVGVAVK